jgi:dTDP-glucose pyrophosphorylase
MDGVGPNGETIMDYSINDAIRAGFGKVVFVIRHDFAEAFQQKINAEHFGNRIQVEYVYQELDKLPAGFKVPEGREKPWGTNHAILMAKDAIHEPFAIINADDFYGRDAFMVIGDYLRTLENTKGQYCMVGYRLENTLSENGTVSRGVCNIDANGNLAGMTERTSIGRNANGVIEYKDTDDSLHPLAPETTVSMNLFGFTPDYFAESEKLLVEWLKERGNEMKSEYYIPYAVNTFINSGYATMKVLKTTAQWFGVTYKEDRPMVVDRLKKLHDQGVY